MGNFLLFPLYYLQTVVRRQNITLKTLKIQEELPMANLRSRSFSKSTETSSTLGSNENMPNGLDALYSPSHFFTQWVFAREHGIDVNYPRDHNIENNSKTEQR